MRELLWINGCHGQPREPPFPPFRISDFERSEATQATHLFFFRKTGQFRIFRIQPLPIVSISALTTRAFALAALAALLAPALPASAQDAIPAAVQQLRQAGPLDLKMRTDTGRDVHLRLEDQYTTQDMGSQLTSEQIEKLDTIRAEAPDKYQILSCLFPQQIAEFLLRSPSPTPIAPADDALQRMVWEIA